MTGLTLANLVVVPAEGTIGRARTGGKGVRGVFVTAGGTGKTDVLIDLVGFLTNP